MIKYVLWQKYLVFVYLLFKIYPYLINIYKEKYIYIYKLYNKKINKRINQLKIKLDYTSFLKSYYSI
jgi:hypothetical protein